MDIEPIKKIIKCPCCYSSDCYTCELKEGYIPINKTFLCNDCETKFQIYNFYIIRDDISFLMKGERKGGLPYNANSTKM